MAESRPVVLAAEMLLVWSAGEDHEWPSAVFRADIALDVVLLLLRSRRTSVAFDVTDKAYFSAETSSSAAAGQTLSGSGSARADRKSAEIMS
jgi:hypothetical protein